MTNQARGVMVFMLLVAGGATAMTLSMDSQPDTLERLEDDLGEYLLCEQWESTPAADRPILKAHFRTGELYSEDGIDWGGFNDPGRISLEAEGGEVSKNRERIMRQLRSSRANAERLLRHPYLNVRLAVMEALWRDCHNSKAEPLEPHIFEVLEGFLDDDNAHLAAYAYDCFCKEKYWSMSLLASSIEHRHSSIRVFGAVHTSDLMRDEAIPREQIFDVIQLLGKGYVDPHPAVRQHYYWAVRDAAKTSLGEVGKRLGKERPEGVVEELLVGPPADIVLGVTDYVAAGREAQKNIEAVINSLCH